MEKHITLLKNNDGRYINDIEWIEEFYYFMQGINPDGIHLDSKLKLKPKQAFSIIWYLQEHFPVFPDNIEKCD